jgi:hypothetical protein
MKKYLFLFVFMYIPAIALCSTTQVLDREIDIRPQVRLPEQ